MIRDASDVLAILLVGGHSVIAGRLAGAFRNIGRTRIADEILSTMKSAGYDARESDPFQKPAPFTFAAREPSPYVTRTRLMWHEMREKIVPLFPAPPKNLGPMKTYMERVDDVYVTDAYHSLSIEGYRVSAELIERVRSGNWTPDSNQEHREQRDALAARGYFDAFQVVKTSVEKVLKGENAGKVADRDHADWYRALFSPSVTVGLIKAADLAGYRTGPVFIRNSHHVPPSREAVRDMMPLLFELLTVEKEPSVRVVLGHFVFVYIHPYFDGNGRTGRFLMNVMLASGGYPWTVIPVERRNEYMEALEAASVDGNIEPFATFLGRLVKDNLQGRPGPKVPER
jgi:Fic/DOC family protein